MSAMSFLQHKVNSTTLTPQFMNMLPFCFPPFAFIFSPHDDDKKISNTAEKSEVPAPHRASALFP